jgi:hypothetical protein
MWNCPAFVDTLKLRPQGLPYAQDRLTRTRQSCGDRCPGYLSLLWRLSLRAWAGYFGFKRARSLMDCAAELVSNVREYPWTFRQGMNCFNFVRLRCQSDSLRNKPENLGRLAVNRPGFSEAVWIKLRGYGHGLQLSVVARFGLGRWDIADRFKDASVIEPVHPFECGEFHRRGVAPGPSAMNDLSFEQAIDRLGERTIVVIADAADRGLDPDFGQAFGVPNGDLLLRFNWSSQWPCGPVAGIRQTPRQVSSSRGFDRVPGRGVGRCS